MKILELGSEDDEIDQRRFDGLMEQLLKAGEGDHFVIDNGAATFLPLINYARENEVFELLEGEGHSVLVHTVITGGQGLSETIEGAHY